MTMNQQICILCLDAISDNFDTLDYSKAEMLEKLSINLDLALTEDSLVCFKCRDALQESYDFKISCLNNDGVYLEAHLHHDSKVKLEGESICRFCVKSLDNDSFVKFDMNEDMYLKDMIHRCLPEIETNITDLPLMCYNCMRNCQNLFTFVVNCSNNEGKIKNYIRTNAASSNGQINLSNAVTFINDNKILETDVNHIKQECCRENLNNSDGDIIVKQEFEQLESDEINIKSEADFWDTDNGIESNSSQGNTASNNKSSKNATMHKCTQCSYETKYKRDLQRHTLTHKDNSEVTLLSCPHCSYETKIKDYLRRHMLVHKDNSAVTMYKCTECNFETKYKKSLLCHSITHKDSSEVTMYKCTQCGFASKQKVSIQSHMLTHKDNSEVVMHRCTECSFETKYKTSLQSHMVTHKDGSEITWYKCTTCNFKSKYKTSLQSHLLTHKDSSEVVMYKCTKCSFKSKHKASVRRHTCYRVTQ